MASLKKIIGTCFCVILSYLLSVDGQGMGGMNLLLGGLRGSGGGGFGSGLFSGGGGGGRFGGGKNRGGGDALASLLAAGIIAKLFKSEPQKCNHHQEGRVNLFNFYQQRNALLQHRYALLHHRNALFHPGYPHFHARYPYFLQNTPYPQNLVPKSTYLQLQQKTPYLPELEQKAPYIPATEIKSPYIQNFESKSPYFQNLQPKRPESQVFDPKSVYLQRRLAYLQQRRAELYPMIPGYQASSESRKIPIISGLLTGFF